MVHDGWVKHALISTHLASHVLWKCVPVCRCDVLTWSVLSHNFWCFLIPRLLGLLHKSWSMPGPLLSRPFHHCLPGYPRIVIGPWSFLLCALVWFQQEPACIQSTIRTCLPERGAVAMTRSMVHRVSHNRKRRGRRRNAWAFEKQVAITRLRVRWEISKWRCSSRNRKREKIEGGGVAHTID